jgi:hypothetical protein
MKKFAFILMLMATVSASSQSLATREKDPFNGSISESSTVEQIAINGDGAGLVGVSGHVIHSTGRESYFITLSVRGWMTGCCLGEMEQLYILYEDGTVSNTISVDTGVNCKDGCALTFFLDEPITKDVKSIRVRYSDTVVDFMKPKIPLKNFFTIFGE